MEAPVFGVGFPARFEVPLQTISCVPVQTTADEERVFSGLGPASSTCHVSAAGSKIASCDCPQGATRAAPTHASWVYAGSPGSHGARGAAFHVFAAGSKRTGPAPGSSVDVNRTSSPVQAVGTSAPSCFPSTGAALRLISCAVSVAGV